MDKTDANDVNAPNLPQRLRKWLKIEGCKMFKLGSSPVYRSLVVSPEITWFSLKNKDFGTFSFAKIQSQIVNTR